MDKWIPQEESLFDLIENIVNDLNAGQHILIYCINGLVRTSTVAAAVLLRLGFFAFNSLS